MSEQVSPVETKTYFGESLEELLPQIRADLGPDALIVRQREGIVGGIGGFFGRKCIEVEAQPALVRSVLPPRAIIDAYDTGEAAEDPGGEPELAPETAFAPAYETQAEPAFAPSYDAPVEPLTGDRLLEALLAQTSPFADKLTSALDNDANVPMTEDAPMTSEPEPQPEPIVLPRRRPATAASPTSAPAPQPPSLDEVARVRRELIAAAVPVRLAGELLAEVVRSLRPFEPDVPVRDLARRVLAQRIPVAGGWNGKRRTVALVGLHGSGRTRAAASLCAAFVRDGRSVAAVSLEGGRTALELARLTDDEVDFHVADAPELAARVRTLVRGAEVVVADTPPLADGIDGNRLAATLELLGALKPDETHLVLPATMSAADAETLVESLAAHRLPTRLIVSHADQPAASGVPVGLALAHRIPVSFVAAGSEVGALRPAAPDLLARLVLQ